MRWIRRILIVLAVLTLLLGVAVGILLSMDLSIFKDEVEAYVSEKTGRSFVIDG